MPDIHVQSKKHQSNIKTSIYLRNITAHRASAIFLKIVQAIKIQNYTFKIACNITIEKFKISRNLKIKKICIPYFQSSFFFASIISIFIFFSQFYSKKKLSALSCCTVLVRK